MLFFQVLLLGGYAYSHFLLTSRNVRRQTMIHVSLLVVAALTLPIIPDATWKPGDGTQPTTRILMLLIANVGLPYFILSSTGPLVQSWYARFYADQSPYRLYALSNIGSLGALLTYPVLVEPQLTTGLQGWIWSAFFAVYAILCAGLAVFAGRQAAVAPESNVSMTTEPTDSLASLGAQLTWLLLPAIASLMLLAITNHLCQDVAVVPFFWVAPLSLYLISFIICFDHPRWYRRRLFAIATLLATFGLCLTLAGYEVDLFLSQYEISDALSKLGIGFEFDDLISDIVIEASVYLTVLFLICMVCHGEVVRCKPAVGQLTYFYLMLSLGGALGGLFVALVCPQFFKTFVELPLGLVAAFLIALGVLAHEFIHSWMLNRKWKRCVAAVLAGPLVYVVMWSQAVSSESDAIVSMRNFYGVLSVDEEDADDPDIHRYELLNGRILHGVQFVDKDLRNTPTTYYDEESGIGVALRRLRATEPIRVAAVGLGVGTIAAYAKKEDYYCFYEINPNVQLLATSQFHFLDDARQRGATIQIQLGDARISMERQSPQLYDVIALDAFSGDAIPAHLLTRESFAEYLRHLSDGGVIAVHISNRHLDLTPVVGGLAEFYEYPMLYIETYDDDAAGAATSDWLLLTRNQQFLEDDIVVSSSEVAEPGSYSSVRPWTDDFTNLFEILEKPEWMSQ